MPSPIDSIGSDAARAFSGWNLAYYGGAIVATAALAESGADHAIRVGVQEHLSAPAWGDAAYYGGYVLPVLIAPGIYVTGLLTERRSMTGAGAAATQALAFTVVTTVVLKVATGRPFPNHGNDPSAPDRLEHPEYAREFVPFGFAGRYAWPSGHTSAAVSIAASLSAYTRDLTVSLVAYPIAAAIGLGMIVGDHHWTSDVVAGALIGQAIGWSVGDSFRRRADLDAPPQIQLVPLLTPSIQGCAVVGIL